MGSAAPHHPLRSFVHVVIPSTMPLPLVVPAASPARSAAAFVEWAKREPGRLNHRSIGAASPFRLSGEVFGRAFGLRVKHVPHRGGAPALTDTAVGNCRVPFDSSSSSAPVVRAGSPRALGTTSARRLEAFPEVPTLAGWGAPGFETGTWSGVVAPAVVEPSTPGSAATPAERRRVQDQGGAPMDLPPAAAAEFVGRGIETWGRVVRAGTITLN